jgi:hypothetical protein
VCSAVASRREINLDHDTICGVTDSRG